MANTEQDSILLSESNARQEIRVSVPSADEGAGPTSVNQEVSNVSETVSITSSSVTPKDSNSTPASTAETRPANTPARPTLVQLGAQSSASASHPPKKFNAVNINKKFLEKNSAAVMATTSSASASSKSTNSMSRPQMQNTPSHSRLVTAKLTGSPAPTTTTGPGWSRPTSTAPSSTGTNSPIGSSPLPTAAVAVSANSVAPQLPHVGKVIQPQPKAAALHATNLQKESAKQSARSAWANVRAQAVPPVMTSEEFPTAAEVAKAMATRRPKTADDQKPASESASTKHRLEEEADTFRGVHLDPNAHHWDEMEEDNDDFLGGVIEFGDGRQYTVEATEPATSPPPSEQPVSKEDRFVDDFDRSWPKSKPSPTPPVPDFPATSPALSGRGTSLHDFTHPQLFNERSNRLEPYSQSSRTGQPAPHNRRGSHNDGSVQLLQKAGNGEIHARSRSGLGPGFIGDRRDGGSRRDHPSSPRMTRQDWGHHEMSPSTSLQGRDREPSERGRRSDMGPPPVPLHATRRLSQESGRQLPPHLSPKAALPRRLPSRDRENRFPLPSSPHSSRFGPPSPALSHTSTLVLSPSTLSNIGLPGADLEEVTKDLMQSAAARAKARKQQEEAEREAQKERARRKAAELEEKLKAAEAEKLKELESVNKEETKIADQEVVEFLESSISGVDGSKSPLSPRRPSIDSASHSKHIPRRTTSQRGQQRRLASEGVAISSARRPSFGIGTRAAVPETSLASQSDSWRVKANPLPPTSPRHAPPRPSVSISDSTQVAPTSLITPSTALDQVANIAEGSMTDLEVVDFTNMDKFVGSEEGVKEKIEVISEVEKMETVTEAKQDVVTPKQRPIASDFFEDGKPTGNSKNENVWKRKISSAIVNEGEERSRPVKDETTVRASGSMSNLPSSYPRIRPHTEASMSALDDVMSRIRGAIEASASSKETRPQEGPPESEQPPLRQSQTSTATPKSSPHGERSQPSPPRLQAEAKLEELRESLDTASDPLHPSPSGDPTVRLPSVSHRIAPVPKRQHIGFIRAPNPARFELLSFEPPVQGMNRRDFSVNAVLFRQQPSFKGSRIRVALPRSRPGPAMVRTVSIGPKSNGAGAFGKSTSADGATSWRRALSTKAAEEIVGKVDEGDPANIGAQGQESKPLDLPLEEPHPHVKVRQPKMPAGSVVAFMRDQRIDTVEADPKPLVNFIMSSDLDESGFEAFSEAEVDKVSIKVESQADSAGSSSLPLLGGTKVDTDTSITRTSPSLVISKLSESKNEDESASRSVSAPSPSHQTTAPSTPWGRASLSLPVKDSTVRPPDPEHLKAVWSQPANKSDLNPVNSLEGIADDLIPFSIQDVKSEDGETPPPALPPATSRMSLHEVTKAFQKVPTSSSSSSTPGRNHISPPSTNSSPATRSPYPYAPMPPNSMRPPHYDPYSPMLTHSPAPTVIYPHQLTPSPVPNRMAVNGHPPMYQGAVWMPTPAPGNPMRPMMSPYAAPMMTYAAPGTPVYAPMGTMPGAPQQPPVGTAPGRGRGVPMVSPAMSHAHAHALPGTPMYAGSPVMMHVPPHTHQNHGAYLNVHPQPGGTPGRGQGRTDMQQPTQSQNNQQPHQPQTYNPAASFIRSTW